jgi:hypothetical protein
MSCKNIGSLCTPTNNNRTSSNVEIATKRNIWKKKACQIRRGVGDKDFSQ